MFVAANGNAREVNGAVVSANFFPLLGVTPALGRFFNREEDLVPDRDRVAVLGYELWQQWFDASPQALGAPVTINGSTFTIIGVARRSFTGVTVYPNNIYIPTMMLRVGYRWCADSLASACTILDSIGRLAKGRTIDEAQSEMGALRPAEWATAEEGENTGLTVFRPGTRRDPAKVQFVRLLLAVAIVLLFVCCANLAGLLIARGSARAHELATRLSLGATRMRLLRQLMTESLLLALIGGCAGLLLSLMLTAALNAMFYSADAEGHRLLFDFSPDPLVILGVGVVSIAAGCLFGLLPALKCISGCAAGGPASWSPRVVARSHAGRWLLGAQAAVAVALVAVAGSLVASARMVVHGTSFEASHVALMRLRPRLVGYEPEKAQRFVRTVIERLEALPGVQSASMVSPGAVLLGGGAMVSRPGLTDSFETGYIQVGPSSSSSNAAGRRSSRGRAPLASR